MTAVADSGYLVLARKWRPVRFDDLLGQGHVGRTLSNAIRSGRVAHAFLFAGVRGVGKTSAARILARALNCREGPTPEPCGTCDACRSIADGSATDVQEIDGASNNSVEDVRRLRENVAYQPAALRTKLYVIDEAHMLSNSAFNALLKTLEEPPPHVKFVFATTEPHKIPSTIHSRCQRYDFRRIPARAIAGRLLAILESEGIRVESEGIRALAEEAGGSMRDALSLLDQVLAAFPEGTGSKEITWLLGVAPQALLARLAGAIVGGDPRAALDAVREADEAGYDLLHFARSILRFFRELVVLASCRDAAGLTELSDAEEAAAREIAGRTSIPHLHRLFLMASGLVDEIARSPLPRVHLDVAAARMASADAIVSLTDILARLERSGGGDPGRGGGGPGPGPVRRSPGPAGDGAAAPFRPPPAPGDAPRPAACGADDEPPDEEPPIDAGPDAGPPEPIVASAAEPRPRAEARAPAAPPDGAAAERWERVIERVRSRDRILGAALLHATPTEVGADRIRLAFPEGATAAETLRQADRAEVLREAAAEVLGGRPEVVVDDRSSEAARAVAERRAERTLAEERRRAEMVSHPAVRDVLQAFPGSRVVEVAFGEAAAGGGAPEPAVRRGRKPRVARQDGSAARSPAGTRR